MVHLYWHVLWEDFCEVSKVVITRQKHWTLLQYLRIIYNIINRKNPFNIITVVLQRVPSTVTCPCVSPATSLVSVLQMRFAFCSSSVACCWISSGGSQVWGGACCGSAQQCLPTALYLETWKLSEQGASLFLWLGHQGSSDCSVW